MKKFLISATLLIALTALIGAYCIRVIKQGADAYLFGYPLVLMELTRNSMANDAEPGRGANHLYHMRSFPDHNFRNVVRPNNDTLYSVTWFDLGEQPMVISTPAMERYYVLPFMDAWTNVFAAIGTSTTGQQAGNYALVGPDWNGELPAGIDAIKAPTNMVWMIGRIQVNSQQDIATVATLQDQFYITPLNRWPAGPVNPASVIDTGKVSASVNPKAMIEELDTEQFFHRLSYLIDAQAPATEDQPALDNLSRFSVFPGQEYKLELVPPLQRHLLVTGMEIANRKLHEATESHNVDDKENGWTVWRDRIGDYGTDYQTRAGVAMVGLGALKPSEAAYPTTHIDSQGALLNGAHSYNIHFPSAPPNNAFWSLTLYDVDGYLTDNPIKRYLLGSRDPLTFNDDGSLDIVIQHQQPASNNSNWLPSPEGEFSLSLRIYRPQASFLSGDWQLPGVERLDAAPAQ